MKGSAAVPKQPNCIQLLIRELTISPQKPQTSFVPLLIKFPPQNNSFLPQMKSLSLRNRGCVPNVRLILRKENKFVAFPSPLLILNSEAFLFRVL